MKKKNAPSEAHLDTAQKAQEALADALAEVDAINARLCSALQVARYIYDAACTEAYALHRVAFDVACKKSAAVEAAFDVACKGRGATEEGMGRQLCGDPALDEK